MKEIWTFHKIKKLLKIFFLLKIFQNSTFLNVSRHLSAFLEFCWEIVKTQHFSTFLDVSQHFSTFLDTSSPPTTEHGPPPPPEWGHSQPKLSIYLQSVERKTNIWGGLTRVGGLAPSFSGWGGSGHFSCKISFTLQNTFSSYFRYKISKKFCLRRTI